MTPATEFDAEAGLITSATVFETLPDLDDDAPSDADLSALAARRAELENAETLRRARAL